MALPVCLYLAFEVAALVKGLPTELIHERRPVDQAHRQLGTELDPFAAFPANDGADPGLIEVDDAILDLLAPLLIHPSLLLIDDADGGQQLPIAGFEDRLAIHPL